MERAEKQIILAKHGRRLLNLLDDSPVVPGDTRTAYDQGAQARQILNDAEDDLRDWHPSAEPLGEEMPSQAKAKEESPEGEAGQGDLTAAEASGGLPAEGSKTTEVAV